MLDAPKTVINNSCFYFHERRSSNITSYVSDVSLCQGSVEQHALFLLSLLKFMLTPDFKNICSFHPKGLIFLERPVSKSRKLNAIGMQV